MDCLTREVAPEFDGPTISCPRCAARIAVSAPTGWTVRSPRDVYDHLGVEMAALEREELRVVVLNAKNLVVRVWGWSGYFCELDEAYQNQIIGRHIYGE